MLIDERLLIILGLTEEELKQQHLDELAQLAYDKGYEFKTDFNAITMEFTITLVPIAANTSLEFLNWQLEIGRKYRENIDEEGSGALFGAYHYLIFVATELEDAESNRKI